MKYFLIIHLLVLLLACGCRGFSSNPIEDFIPGTYIRFSQHEFGTEYDTLLITRQSQIYHIKRKWKYERTLDGKLIEPEYKTSSSTAIYKDKLLVEQETGSSYTFDIKRKSIVNGQTVYKKL